MKTTCQVNKIDFNFIFQNSFPLPPPPSLPPITDATNLLKSCPTKRKLSSGCVGVFTQYTAISRKVVGNSARDNPKGYCGWF